MANTCKTARRKTVRSPLRPASRRASAPARISATAVVIMATIAVVICSAFAAPKNKKNKQGNTQPQVSGNTTPSPTPQQNTGQRQNNVVVPIININPPGVEFETGEQTSSDTRMIAIGGANNSWTFVRAKEIDNRITLTLSRNIPQNNLTLPPGTQLSAGQWFGFTGDINLDVTLRKQGLPDSGSLNLILEKGWVKPDEANPSAAGPPTSKQAAIEALNSNRVDSANSPETINVSWNPPAPDILDRLVWWGLGAIALIVVLYLLYRFDVWQRIRNRFEAKRSEDGRASVQNQANSFPSIKEIGAELEKRMEEKLNPISSSISSLSAKVGGNTPQPLTKKDLESVFSGEPVVGKFRNLTAEAAREVSSKVDNLEKRINQLLGQLGALATTERLQEVEQNMKSAQESLAGKQSEVSRFILDENIHQAQDLRQAVAEIKQMLEQRNDQSTGESKLLGNLLGENVEALREDNFQELAAELDRFFREQIPQTDDRLKELQQRVESIHAALNKLLEKVREKKSEVDKDFLPHVGRAKELVSNLSHLYSQMERRQLTLNLHVPVAAHASARHTFLEELGMSVKREIEKLRDPHCYFERELERLVTSEIVPIVEICDKKVAQPGQDNELEDALRDLLSQARLRGVLPKPGEQFQSNVQDLVQSIAHQNPGDSLTIARVVSRGLYYEPDGASTLLRKAGVEIYV